MQALVIQHIACEGLGNLSEILIKRGFTINTIRVWMDNFADFDPISPDLLIILGGPIGVNDTDVFPILREEIEFIKKRTANPHLATLGICLGSQIIAHTLGAEVYKGLGTEIGWKEITIHNESGYEYFLPLNQLHVLHWHGDTFKLPPGYNLLVSSQLYPNQGYISNNHKILGLQFHLEVKPEDFEGWLITNFSELLDEPQNIISMRNDAKIHGTHIQAFAIQFWNQWLDRAFPLEK